MPYKNRSTPSFEGNMYHIYARGINKINIFNTHEDKLFFIYLIKRYLIKNYREIKTINSVPHEFQVNSAYEYVEIQGFCLMDNHFHFLVYCKKDEGISKFMTRILSNYTGYFNKKDKREGQLFQGSYRSVWISSEYQLNVVGVHIHLNPDIKKTNLDPKFYSKAYYISKISPPWLVLNKTLLQNINFKDIRKHSNLLETQEIERHSLGLI